jgi:hypothetical protein
MAARTMVLLVVIVLAVGALTGCSCAAEEASEALVEQSTGGEVEIDDEGESISIETEEGSMEISGGDSAAVPDGFPSDMPLYDGTIVMGQVFETEEGTAFNVGITTSDSANDVAAWYSDEFSAEGWSVTSEMTNDSGDMTMVTYQVEKGGTQAQVIIAEEAGETQIAVTVAEE